jgi:uncharacterized cupredoxin-like copper-binding protein
MNGRTLAFALFAALCPAAGTSLAQPADPWANAEPMTVVMVDNRFEPDHLTFHAGKAYALTLENRGKDLHEFTAPDFLKAAKVQDPKLLANGGADVVVQPGKTVRILLVAPPKGQYELTCADHDWDGMVGTISVD